MELFKNSSASFKKKILKIKMNLQYLFFRLPREQKLPQLHNLTTCYSHRSLFLFFAQEDRHVPSYEEADEDGI